MHSAPTPAFVTGTSSEYLGRRPLRKIVRERPVIVLLGPRGSGKTSVARRIARHGVPVVTYLDTAALQDAILARARRGAWDPAVVKAPSLVLDGPLFLQNRPAVVKFLQELIGDRIAAQRRTVLCQVAMDGSTPLLMGGVPPGCMVTVGLRFPKSRSGRMRFARRVCDELGLSRSEAQGTGSIEPWGYEAVIAELRRRKRNSLDIEPIPVVLAAGTRSESSPLIP